MKIEQTALDMPALVRARDYRRFLAIQFAPRAQRPALYVLTAFANEMEHIPHHVKEPLAGFMRYAWWREGLQEMQAGKAPRAHPMLQELSSILTPPMYPLLDTIITSGQQELEGDSPDALHMRETALDALWEMVLGGQAGSAQKALKSLPLGQKIGPRQLLRVIFKNL